MNDHAATAAARRHNSAQRTRRALPGQLFYSTQIPVCLRFLAKNKSTDASRGYRDRRQQTDAGLAVRLTIYGEHYRIRRY